MQAGSAGAQGPGIRTERHPDRARLAELYAGAVALVHPALDEGFGLTALEAMSLGVPVIAARAPGIARGVRRRGPLPRSRGVPQRAHTLRHTL